MSSIWDIQVACCFITHTCQCLQDNLQILHRKYFLKHNLLVFELSLLFDKLVKTTTCQAGIKMKESLRRSNKVVESSFGYSNRVSFIMSQPLTELSSLTHFMAVESGNKKYHLLEAKLTADKSSDLVQLEFVL